MMDCLTEERILGYLDWADGDTGAHSFPARAIRQLKAEREKLIGALEAAVEYMAAQATGSGEPYPLERCRAALAAIREGL